jgi:hypothetical protein
MKKTHLSIKYYISVLFFFTLSCGVSKINNSNNTSLDSSKYTTSFLMKDGSILYFVKPIKLNSKDKEINVDFTLINKDDKFNDSVKIGLSLISDIKLETKTIKEIYFDTTKLNDFEIIYNDPLGKKFEIRILSAFFYENIKKMNENSSVTIKFDSTSENFIYSSKSKKIIRNLVGLIN